MVVCLRKALSHPRYSQLTGFGNRKGGGQRYSYSLQPCDLIGEVSLKGAKALGIRIQHYIALGYQVRRIGPSVYFSSDTPTMRFFLDHHEEL